MTDAGGWTPGERAAKDPHQDPNPEPWWKTAVFYQIYPRSFLDTPIGEWADRGAAYRANYPGCTLADTNVSWGYGEASGHLRAAEQNSGRI